MTRPPARGWVRPPSGEAIVRLIALLSERSVRAEQLIGYEGNEFSHTGDASNDLLSISAVHPLRWDAVDELLVRDGATWETIRGLIEDGSMAEHRYRGQIFFTRTIKKEYGTEEKRG